MRCPVPSLRPPGTTPRSARTQGHHQFSVGCQSSTHATDSADSLCIHDLSTCESAATNAGDRAPSAASPIDEVKPHRGEIQMVETTRQVNAVQPGARRYLREGRRPDLGNEAVMSVPCRERTSTRPHARRAGPGSRPTSAPLPTWRAERDCPRRRVSIGSGKDHGMRFCLPCRAPAARQTSHPATGHRRLGLAVPLRRRLGAEPKRSRHKTVLNESPVLGLICRHDREVAVAACHELPFPLLPRAHVAPGQRRRTRTEAGSPSRTTRRIRLSGCAHSRDVRRSRLETTVTKSGSDYLKRQARENASATGCRFPDVLAELRRVPRFTTVSFR